MNSSETELSPTESTPIVPTVEQMKYLLHSLVSVVYDTVLRSEHWRQDCNIAITVNLMDPWSVETGYSPSVSVQIAPSILMQEQAERAMFGTSTQPRSISP